MRAMTEGLACLLLATAHRRPWRLNLSRLAIALQTAVAMLVLPASSEPPTRARTDGSWTRADISALLVSRAAHPLRAEYRVCP